jgi:hypothetical protein
MVGWRVAGGGWRVAGCRSPAEFAGVQRFMIVMDFVS